MARMVPCFCGGMAEVDEWNAKGIRAVCQNCGYIELDRDTLYRYGMYYHSAMWELEQFRNFCERDSKDEDLDDSYREACQMVVNEMEEIFKRFSERKKEEFEELRIQGVDDDE